MSEEVSKELGTLISIGGGGWREGEIKPNPTQPLNPEP